MSRFIAFPMIVILTSAFVGCAHYTPPGAGADLRMMGAPAQPDKQPTDFSIQSKFDKQPMARFPTAIAMVRVQGPEYASRTISQTHGTGRYCVVTTRDVESDTKIGELARLPMIAGLAPLNRLVLPSVLNSDYELRHAAADLQADMLLIYTLDTRFSRKDASTPLNLITLGITPTQEARISCTASAILMDTRSGYIYGIAEGTQVRHAHQNAWVTEAAIDNDRRAVESAAFGKLVDELAETWSTIVRAREG